MSSRSNTASNNGDNGKKKMPKGKPFEKGDDRINRNGRPRSFDQLRDLAQDIAMEPARDEKGKLLRTLDGKQLTVATAILKQWARSPEPQLQLAFIHYAYGKVPDKVEVPLQRDVLLLSFEHERADRAGDERIPSATPHGSN